MINESSHKKKLIEVAMPLEAINEGSKPETENPFLKGHPRAVHNWWARTPLSVSRAVLFAQLIDDPGEGLSPKEAQKTRKKLLDFVSKLATWEATSDNKLIEKAREMIQAQFKGEPLEFWDMFAGRASIPLEAQRLGLRVTSSDLNPVAVTIQRALLEFPSKFKNRAPIHPDSEKKLTKRTEWKAASGLIEDIRWYGELVNIQASQKLDRLYPRGLKGEIITAWLWARTVKCPNPACGGKMPLVRSFALATKNEKNVYIHPKIDKIKKEIVWEVHQEGHPPKGTVGRGGARCIFCDCPVDLQYIRNEGKEGRITYTMMAAVSEGNRQRIYIPPSLSQIKASEEAQPKWMLEVEIPKQAQKFATLQYGMTKYSDLFTSRQLAALTSLCDTIKQLREQIELDAKGDKEYANAIILYLACALSRLTDYINSLCTWNPTNENIRNLFQRQAVPMVWDFVEGNPLNSKLSFAVVADWIASSLELVPVGSPARVIQLDARATPPKFSSQPVISTDPPYYGNISYAELSDYFYVWLRTILRYVDPQTFATVLTPKESELIALAHWHNGSRALAEKHFREGFAVTFKNVQKISRTDVPITIYYAYKQQEEEEDGNEDIQRVSTGWETMLEGLVDAGFQITGTWPVRTTKKARAVALGTNALASAVVLVARQLKADAQIATRKEFITTLKKELPSALAALTQISIAPVDLAQASIGPGMSVFSRYSKVLEADGTPMTIRTALQIINQELDTYLTEQESDMDKETMFCIAWYEQFGWMEGPFGDANTLSTAKGTAVNAIEQAGILYARAGKVRLLNRKELDPEWDPTKKKLKLTVWECAQHLIKTLDDKGENGAAEILKKIGGQSEPVKELSYRLYNLCEKKGWTEDSLAYNNLISSWQSITDKAQFGAGISEPAKKELKDKAQTKLF